MEELMYVSNALTGPPTIETQWPNQSVLVSSSTDFQMTEANSGWEARWLSSFEVSAGRKVMADNARLGVARELATLNIHKPCPSSFLTGTKYFSTSIHIFNHNSFGEKSSQQLLLFKLSLNSVGFSSDHQITWLKYHKYEPSLQNHNIIARYLHFAKF